MKKTIAVFAALFSLFLCPAVFAAKKTSAKKTIVCTAFPQYDWCRQIIGEKAGQFDLVLLLDKGTDLHSFQPSFADIARISSCDMFVYGGGESDEWVSGVLAEAKNKELCPVSLMEILGENVKEEKFVEGMQHSHECDEDEHDHEHHDEIEYDEHIWLSLKNAQVLVRALAEKICALDPENVNFYMENSSRYIAELASLDSEYEAAVSSAKFHTLLFADRFPFRYLADDYGLDYYAAFVGCSAETEASFETVVFLARKIDSLNLGCVLTIEKSDKGIARTVIANTQSKNQKILEMDSIQSVMKKDISSGKTYLESMRNNLSVLKTALN
ncbi:metal ABC transporter substrate-binding protein [Treponema sp.]|uniref:metal ABC transporter substrate-binding protein n=1 Tax=Treponema sp. TaxID=166 RepID=UPI003F0A121C